jgi:hypothetical protein
MITRKSGADQTTEATYSSRIPIPADIKKDNPDNVAVCNATAGMSFLSAQSMVYYDTSLQPRYDAIRVWIPRISPDFQDTKYHIKFFKWKADAQGEVYFEKVNLQLRMEKRTDKKNASGYLDSINWAKMRDALIKDNIDVSNMNTIFNDYSFAVLLEKPKDGQTTPIPYSEDPSVDYDVLKIAVYKDTTLVDQTDFLLPAFYAHPAKFFEGKPEVLRKLHPFYKDISSAWPGAHFAELLNANCF